MANVVLISCVKKKLGHAAQAKDLYASPLFKLSLEYARTLNPDKIFILSAKYRLLSLEKVVEPYNQTLKLMKSAERKEWAAEVLKELNKETDLKNDRFVLLAGKPYLERIEHEIAHREEPLKGLPIGKRVSRLKELIKG
jgi:hypothetical protein